MSIVYPYQSQSQKWMPWASGRPWNGIADIIKINTVWLVDTYRILFTNGTYTDYDVTNWLIWSDGTDWVDGIDWKWIASHILFSTVGLVKTYRITYNDASTFDYTVTDGADWVWTWDVVWPASATDNAVARFDSTTGKLLQNSGVTISDTNNVSTDNSFATTNLWWTQLSMQSGWALIKSTNGNVSIQSGFASKQFSLANTSSVDKFVVALDTWNTTITGTVWASNLSGTNTGDQTSIVGITGTLAQFNTACTDADFATWWGTATGSNTGDNSPNTNSWLVHTTWNETIAWVKTFSDEVKITYWKWIFNNWYTIPALKTDWSFPDTWGWDSTRITPAWSAVTSNMVYSWSMRNGSKWDFYVEWKQTVTGGQVLSWTWRLLDIWDDAAFYDVNSANTVALKWIQDATIGRLQLWTSAYVQWNGDGSMNLNGTIITSWNIELGNASDTTISRVSAGKIAVEGVNLLTTSSTETVTNKRVTKRVESVSSSATPASNTDSYDVTKITGLAVAITSLTSGLTGTPVDWDLHLWSFTDNGTARAITPWASFENSTVTFPTTTVISTRLDVLCEWNSATSKWRVVAVA